MKRNTWTLIEELDNAIRALDHHVSSQMHAALEEVLARVALEVLHRTGGPAGGYGGYAAVQDGHLDGHLECAKREGAR